jgi:23S rRNA (adenine2503-C2)-methyltransferase
MARASSQAHHADVGSCPEIVRAGHEIGSMLAISLHATNDAVRDRLGAAQRKYRCRAAPRAGHIPAFPTPAASHSNMSCQSVNGLAPYGLVKLLRGIPAKVNLIPFNPWPGSAYECSDGETIERFAAVLNRAGYASPVRTPRGRDILAACGQLKSASERLRARARQAAVAAVE